MTIDWKVVWKYVSEPLRWLAIGVVAYLLEILLPQVKHESVPYIIIVLRFIDKWLHDVGKAVDSDILTRGLTQF